MPMYSIKLCAVLDATSLPPTSAGQVPNMRTPVQPSMLDCPDPPTNGLKHPHINFTELRFSNRKEKTHFLFRCAIENPFG